MPHGRYFASHILCYVTAKILEGWVDILYIASTYREVQNHPWPCLPQDVVARPKIAILATVLVSNNLVLASVYGHVLVMHSWS